ncbi:hypothetical protein SCHPADRAFT_907989, partial [Schizopora paradoxa]
PMRRPSSPPRVHPSASKSRCAGGAYHRLRWAGCRPQVNRYRSGGLLEARAPSESSNP